MRDRFPYMPIRAVRISANSAYTGVGKNSREQGTEPSLLPRGIEGFFNI
jgi:hypothetical protein